MAARPSHFLGLPPELRTWIYSLHFTDETITLQEPNHCVNIAGTEQWKIITQTIAPGFLLSNEQIYGEAISLYYSCLTLRICPLREWDIGGADRCALEMVAFWLDAIPRKWHQQISSIVINGARLAWHCSFEYMDNEERQKKVKTAGGEDPGG